MEIADELTFLADHIDDFARLPGSVERFRGAILQCALAGLLSAPDSSDEPAEELLSRATAAKDAYVGKGRSVGRVGKGRGRWDDDSSDLPPGWTLTTMEQITTKVGSGSTPRGGREVYVSSGPKFLRSQNVWNDGLRLDGVAHIPPQIHERMAGTAVSPNDVLLNITGASIGRAAVAPDDIGDCNVSQHVMIIRPALPELAPFLHLYVISPAFQAMIDSVQVGISRDGLSKQSVLGMPVPLPPLEEQGRIVQHVASAFSRLSELERALADEEAERSRLSGTALRELAVSQNDRALALIDDVVRTEADVDGLEVAIVQLAVSGALSSRQHGSRDVEADLGSEKALERPMLVSKGGTPRADPHPIPEHWRWAPLGAVLRDIQGGWSPAAQPQPKQGDEWGVLKVSACSWGAFRPDENKALGVGEAPRVTLEVKPGDFLISRANTSALVGRSVVVRDTPPHLMLSDKTLRLSVVDWCNPRYLTLANLARAAREHYETEATGTSSSMKNVSQKIIRRAPVPLPPSDEQDQIVVIVDQLMALVAQLRLTLADV